MMTIFTSNNNNNNNNYDDDENHYPYDFTKQENSEQCAVIDRIRSENRVPVTGPPGTGKSTVISQSCFDLINEYSPVLLSLLRMRWSIASLLK
jgi:HrpA-like RNA helicase